MDEVIRLADQFRRRAQDVCDKPQDPRAVQLRSTLQAFFGDTKSRNDPDFLFERVKNIEAQVQNLRNLDVYSPADVSDMYDRCQDLKVSLRELSKRSNEGR